MTFSDDFYDRWHSVKDEGWPGWMYGEQFFICYLHDDGSRRIQEVTEELPMDYFRDRATHWMIRTRNLPKLPDEVES